MRQTHARHYDSVQALLRVKPSEQNRETYTGFQRNRGRSFSGISWYGTEGGWDGVERLLNEGWPEGLRRMEDAVKALVPSGVATIRRRRKLASFGDNLDIQRVYAGDLDRAWDTTERSPQRGLGRIVVTLLVNLGANANVTSEQLFWKGASAVALAKALEESGRRVRIIGYTCGVNRYEGEGEDDWTVDTVMLKDEAEPLDLERLAVTTGLAGFFRRYLFTSYLNTDDKARGSLGSSKHFARGSMDASDLATVPEALRELAGSAGTINIDAIWDMGSSQRFIDGIVAGFGAEKKASAY
jgi:hypothetical protein